MTFHTRPDVESDAMVVREMAENVYRLHAEQLRGSGVVVDIGANIGAFAKQAAETGARRVICYEPQPDNRAVLERNLAEIGVRGCNFEVHPEAVVDVPGFVCIGGIGGGARVGLPGPMVLGIVLDDVLRPLRSVDVLKVDTEGSEYGAFATVQSEALSLCRRVVIEFHETDATTFGILVAKLTRTHAVQTLGSYERGGYLYCDRY